MNRLAFGLVVFLALLFSPQLSQEAWACSCLGTPDIGIALSRADAVFSGRVVMADRFMAQFEVDNVWKGQERSRITMLTGARDLGNDRFMISSCDYNYAAGQKYVVYAAGPPNALISQPCSRTAIQSDAETQGLDAIVPRKKVADEVRSCISDPVETAASAERTAGEIRIVMATSGAAALPAVTASVDGTGQRHGALTDAAGRATFSRLPLGEYKITADLEGYVPKQTTVTIPSAGCVEASLFLLRPAQ